MKKLIMVIMIPVFVILGTPALLAAIIYDGSGENNMPVHLYTEDANAEQMLLTELRDSIDDVKDGITQDMEFQLHEDIINTAIFQGIREENADYMPTDTCDNDACNYIVAEPVPIEGFEINLRVVGAWVNFEQDKFIFSVFLEVQLDDGFTYRTVVETHFKLDDKIDRYEIEFDKVQLGNLPIPKSLITSIFDLITKQFPEVNLDDQEDKVPLGELDIANMSYTLLKADILDKLEEEQAQNPDGDDTMGLAFASQVLSIIFDNGLVEFEAVDNEFVLTAGVSKFRSDDTSDIPAYLYEMHDENGFNPDLFDPEEYLKNQFTSFVFTSALTDEPFRINERLFNKMIYHGANGFKSARTTQTLKISETESEEISVGLEALWFEIDDDGILVNALFEIAGIKSLFTITADEISDAANVTELIFEFTEINFGKDLGEVPDNYLSVVDLDVFKQLFKELDDFPIGTFNDDGNLVITTAKLTELLSEGTQEGTIVIDSLNTTLDAILIGVAPDPANQTLVDALDAFKDEISTVIQSEELLAGIDGVLDNETPGVEQDVYNSVVDIQAALADPSDDNTVTGDDIEALFESVSALDEDTQQAFFDQFEALIDPETFTDYEDLFTNPDTTTTP
ncbi:hypothetical protein CI105_01700 [Candidatus Izimaplasma bacterium ZiA1]|uniref:hypothetical protein n=1 Tax=Candidatus Izimoplasma sp. ZiA1 TaxID=2024899 RepID=UPI000BAA5AD7|nr:hypothetical protein CI105_01700 [Candidatus Izimaplasma bacterium ZiA1]